MAAERGSVQYQSKGETTEWEVGVLVALDREAHKAANTHVTPGSCSSSFFLFSLTPSTVFMRVWLCPYKGGL